MKRLKPVASIEIIILVLSLFAFPFMLSPVNLVSATNIGCCEETNNGAVCQDLPTNSNECSENILPTVCEEVTGCEIGCCIDSERGICTEGSSRAKCELDGGIWDDDTACNIEECQNGCCVLGSQTKFITEKSCAYWSEFYGLEKDFKQQINSEVECIALAQNQKRGACVLDEGACDFVTKAECIKRDGSFHEDYLCSNPSLNTTCEKQVYVNCDSERDEVFWFDSCGNRENIYDSNEEVSWNNGKVLSKVESCNSDSANIDSSTCGNCNYYLGSVCAASDNGVEDGDYSCQDLNCYNTYDGSDRKHGESWCVYDASIGNGTDVVGSRHWLHMCLEGEEIVEPCGDYRTGICAEESIDLGGEEMSFAKCVVNEWATCLNYNNIKNTNAMISECNSNNHCFAQKVWHPGSKVSNTAVWVCLPQYPPGLNFWEPSSGSDELCSFASQDVKVVKVKKCRVGGLFGSSWKYVANKVAKTYVWTQSMNKWCTSLGDCGAYSNIQGDVTDGGYSVSGRAKALTQNYLNKLSEFKIPNPEVKGKLSGDASSLATNTEGEFSWMNVIGAGGSAYLVWGKLGAASAWFWGNSGTLITDTTYTTAASTGTTGVASNLPSTAQTIIASPYFTVASTLVASYFVGNIIGSILGVDEQTVQDASYASTAAAATYMGYTAYSVSTFGGGAGLTGTSFMNAFSFTAALGWAAVAAIMVSVISKVMDCGKKKTYNAGFECSVWEAPVGGENCGKCGDEFHPCSEYRCKSLGAACEFIDEDTSNPKCIWNNPEDITPPIITPWTESLPEGYNFENSNSCPDDCSSSVKSSSGSGCLEAFEAVTIGIKTDEYAKCNYDFEDKNYDEMVYSFSDTSETEHATIIKSPGVKTLEAELERLRKEYEGTSVSDYEDSEDYYEDSELMEILFDKGIEDNLDMYIKCQDPNGNINSVSLVLRMCLDPEPDLTAPYVTSISPTNNSKTSWDATSKNITMYVNEPAECKYSFTDKDYSLMGYDFDCLKELEDGSINGWMCFTNLILEDENSIFIRCKDQPFEEEENRNANSESYKYVLKRSNSNLIIDSISPSGDIKAGFEPITVELKIETSEGANEGVATCYYKFSDDAKWTEFRDTSSNMHSQKFNTLTEGEYNVYVRCEDYAGNSDERNVGLKLEVDGEPPQVIRVFSEAGKLKLTTNEKASCYYDNYRCNYDIANASSMSIGLSRTHSTDWNIDKTYYVKCKDSFGNAPSDCTIKIKPSTI